MRITYNQIKHFFANLMNYFNIYSNKIIVLLFFIYVLLISIPIIYNYTHYYIPGLDPAVYTQGMWLTSQFQDPIVTVKWTKLINYWAKLSSKPIYFTIIPFYWLGVGNLALYLVPPIVYGAGSLIIFRLVKEKIESKYASLLGLSLVLAYLFHPGIYEPIVRWGFRTEFFAPLLILTFLYLAEKNRIFYSLIPLVLLFFVKINLVLIGIFLGLYVFVNGRYLAGLIASSLSALYFFVLRGVISGLVPQLLPPSPDKQGPGLEKYFIVNADGILGVIKYVVFNPIEILNKIITNGSLDILYKILVPLGFIPLLGGSSLIIGVSEFAQLLLSKPHWFYRFDFTHYASVPLIAILIFSSIIAVLSVYNITRRNFSERYADRVLLIISIFLLLTTFGANWHYHESPLPFVDRAMKNPFDQPEYVRNVEEVMDQIPGSASVTANNNLVYPLAHRKEVYLLAGLDDVYKDKPDYVLTDREGGDWPLSDRGYKKIIHSLLIGDKYGLQTYEGSVLLFKHGLERGTQMSKFEVEELRGPEWSRIVNDSDSSDSKARYVPEFGNSYYKTVPITKEILNKLPGGNYTVNFRLKFKEDMKKENELKHYPAPKLVAHSGAESSIDKDESVKKAKKSFRGKYSWVLAELGFDKWNGIIFSDNVGQGEFKQDTDYLITYWAKNTASQPVTIGIAGENGKAVKTIPPNSDWTCYSETFNTGQISKIRFQNRNNNLNLDGRLYVDEVKIFRTSSPYYGDELALIGSKSLASISVLDLTEGVVVNQKLITNPDKGYSNYTINFTSSNEGVFDYRVFSSGKTSVWIDKIIVRDQN